MNHLAGTGIQLFVFSRTVRFSWKHWLKKCSHAHDTHQGAIRHTLVCESPYLACNKLKSVISGISQKSVLLPPPQVEPSQKSQILKRALIFLKSTDLRCTCWCEIVLCLKIGSTIIFSLQLNCGFVTVSSILSVAMCLELLSLMDFCNCLPWVTLCTAFHMQPKPYNLSEISSAN